MPRLPGKGWFADSVLLFALSAYLIWPWFRLEYLDSWGSIESTFIGDSRMLRERGFQAEWQPNWYLGTRFDYVYPPALRCGAAAVSEWLGVSTARGYHVYTGTLYCLGIVGIYWLVRVATGWRMWAWIAALGVLIYSPTYLFLRHFEEGYRAVRYMPLRLGVLVRYGEGPHISALSMLGFALAASWWGLRRGHRTALVLAAIFSAAVVANNFYGATALAIFFPLLVWTVALAENDAWVAVRAAAIAALAYGLTACWLTPSYLRVTLENMRLVSQPGHTWSILLEIAMLAAFAAVSWRWARGRTESAWTVFVAGGLARISLYVLGNYYLDFRNLGEPERLCPEFDQFVVLAAVTALAWLARHGLRGKAAVIVAVHSSGEGARASRRVSTHQMAVREQAAVTRVRRGLGALLVQRVVHAGRGERRVGPGHAQPGLHHGVPSGHRFRQRGRGARLAARHGHGRGCAEQPALAGDLSRLRAPGNIRQAACAVRQRRRRSDRRCAAALSRSRAHCESRCSPCHRLRQAEHRKLRSFGGLRAFD